MSSDPVAGHAYPALTVRQRIGTGDWHAVLRRYLVVIALGNFVWEMFHMPLYTIWREGTWNEIAFAALHCTGGDILIALSSLILALLLAGNCAWPRERFRPVAALALAFGVGYTIFSEWLNIVVQAAWAYSELMPVVSFFGVTIGISPLLQWIIVPGFAFAVARRGASSTRSGTPGAGEAV